MVTSEKELIFPILFGLARRIIVRVRIGTSSIRFIHAPC
jgi:hypothetical protein